MNTFRRTVSAEAIDLEWTEIQAAQKDPALFKPLYNRYFEQIFQFIYKRTLDEDLCADICSKVFLKAMQRLEGYSFQGVPFSAWLFRIASNEVAQHYRQTKKSRVVSIEDYSLNSMLDEMDTDDLAPFRAVLAQSLDELKEGDLEIIELRFFEQRPFKEVADLLDITESNAKVRTYRVLERLKKIMIKNSQHSKK
ncbi:MAG: sigma-70 family RNA polymerase sigma factor [Saprospiraceae bacterium]